MSAYCVPAHGPDRPTINFVQASGRDVLYSHLGL